MKFLKLLAVPFVFLFIGWMRLLYPKKLVRVGELWNTRLGHLVGNTECYLCERDAVIQPKALDFWYPVGESSNKYIEKKYRKKLHMLPGWFGTLVMKVNRLFLGWERYVVTSSQFDRDIHHLWEKHSPHIGFTGEEERKGLELLRSLGIPPLSKWVCLIVRDSAYLKQFSENYAYHDYRDSDIRAYDEAVFALVDRGYYVLRMGAKMGKPWGLKHPRLIDYTEKRTEFGDLYLGAKCAFCLGSSTGFTVIPQAFDRPIAFVNHAPLEYSPLAHRGLMIWKHHFKDGKRMSPKEIFESGAGQFTFKHQFDQAGITLKDNTSQEILDLAMEMSEQDANVFSMTDQSEFWNNFPKSLSPYNHKPLNNPGGKTRIRIGRKFLKGYA